jgi:hypothetical protein
MNLNTISRPWTSSTRRLNAKLTASERFQNCEWSLELGVNVQLTNWRSTVGRDDLHGSWIVTEHQQCACIEILLLWRNTQISDEDLIITLTARKREACSVNPSLFFSSLVLLTTPVSSITRARERERERERESSKCEHLGNWHKLQISEKQQGQEEQRQASPWRLGLQWRHHLRVTTITTTITARVCANRIAWVSIVKGGPRRRKPDSSRAFLCKSFFFLCFVLLPRNYNHCCCNKQSLHMIMLFLEHVGFSIPLFSSTNLLTSVDDAGTKETGRRFNHMWPPKASSR